MQVRINKNTLMTLVDGTDVTDELIANNGTAMYSDNKISLNRTSNTSVRITFMSGVGMEVALRTGFLSFLGKMPLDFMGRIRGLLGDFDGNASNDFIFPNGTMLPINSSDREIHNYGQSCRL